MKIDVVTLSTNDNPMYYDFWEPLSKLWKTKFNIHPVLVYCGEEVVSMSEEYGDVHYVPAVSGVDEFFPSTWGRFWIAKEYPDKICMTGDIDMAPISHDFFRESVASLDEGIYTHLNCDAYGFGNPNHWREHNQTLPAYYHVAKGSIFDEVYKFDAWEDEIKKVFSYEYPRFAKSSEPHLQQASKWCLDELYSTMKLREYENNGGKVETRLLHKPRLDRISWSYQEDDIIEGTYRDSHLLRPYSIHKKEIDKVLELISTQ
tara:strand:+ start:1260 stop:2039 length:780 start_codon:yes stop_codon:yes gene_type:complete